MVPYRVLVGWPSWCGCASRLLGHLSQVGSVLILHPGFLFSGLVVRGAFHRVPSPLFSFGMWSPFGVVSVFCHYRSPTKFAIGGVFLLCGSLPFSSAVVVSLRPLSLCLGSWWLVTALFPSLSLFLPVPFFSWLRLLLRQGPWVCYLALPMVVRALAVGPGVSYASWLSFALHRALGLLVPVATLLHYGSLPSRWGHPCGVEVCLSSIETKV